ncbi:hypothetical protein PV327_011547, partial [Microctonus hyperodae]
DEHALNAMLITNMGIVHEPSNKVLLSDIHDKKKALAEHSKCTSGNNDSCQSSIGCNWKNNPSSTTANLSSYTKTNITYENDVEYAFDGQYNRQLSSQKSWMGPMTQIFPHNLETYHQHHNHQEVHNECSVPGTGVGETLDDEQCYHQKPINTSFGENDTKETSDESDDRIDEYDSDTSNVSCFEKNVQSTARVLSGVIPVK